MKFAISLAAAALAAAGAPCHAALCASSVGALRTLAADAVFPLQWVETTMSDGRPLVLSISEHEGSLFLRVRKTREGLWAEGAARVCLAGSDALEATIARQGLHLGPAAHWIFRLAAREGARFMLTPLAGRRLRVAATGWSGVFSPAEEPPVPAGDDPGTPPRP